MDPTSEARAQRERDFARFPASSGNTRMCPWSADTMKRAAVVCRRCDRDVPSVANTPPATTTPDQRVWFRELALSCGNEADDVATLVTSLAAAPASED